MKAPPVFYWTPYMKQDSKVTNSLTKLKRHHQSHFTTKQKKKTHAHRQRCVPLYFGKNASFLSYLSMQLPFPRKVSLLWQRQRTSFLPLPFWLLCPSDVSDGLLLPNVLWTFGCKKESFNRTLYKPSVTHRTELSSWSFWDEIKRQASTFCWNFEHWLITIWLMIWLKCVSNKNVRCFNTVVRIT